MVALMVRPLEREDVFEDMVRVHLSHRPKSKAGAVIKVSANGRTTRAIARGAPKNSRDEIFLDLATRQKLGLNLNQAAELKISAASTFDELIWAWNATNAMPRIASRLAVLSVVLGFVGLLLGSVSLLL